MSSNEARRDFHFTTPARRADLWHTFEMDARGSHPDLGQYRWSTREKASEDSAGQLGHFYFGSCQMNVPGFGGMHKSSTQISLKSYFLCLIFPLLGIHWTGC